jgi:hypothetical protein
MPTAKPMKNMISEAIKIGRQAAIIPLIREIIVPITNKTRNSAHPIFTISHDFEDTH